MSNAIATVWRIFRFRERFELPDDVRSGRKSGLHSTRDFVSAGGGKEAAEYFRQFGLLNNSDGLEMAMLKGIYRRLINLAAQNRRGKRGYLIDHENQPLSDGQIGKLLNINAPDMRKILRRFVNVGLIENVPLPDFAADSQARNSVGQVW